MGSENLSDYFKEKDFKDNSFAESPKKVQI
jgi:hypothetical protein